jgi:hypothetical protein
MQACITECLSCHQVCLSTATGHCLEMGGPHVEPEHMRIMLACAEICRTSAYFMLIGSRHHSHVCRECAEICDECARSCEAIGSMEACALACRRCAQSCRSMAA